MTTSLPPSVANGMFQKPRKSETEESLERATTAGGVVPGGEAESSETILRRTVDTNAKTERK